MKPIHWILSPKDIRKASRIAFLTPMPFILGYFLIIVFSLVADQLSTTCRQCGAQKVNSPAIVNADSTNSIGCIHHVGAGSSMHIERYYLHASTRFFSLILISLILSAILRLFAAYLNFRQTQVSEEQRSLPDNLWRRASIIRMAWFLQASVVGFFCAQFFLSGLDSALQRKEDCQQYYYGISPITIAQAQLDLRVIPVLQSNDISSAISLLEDELYTNAIIRASPGYYFLRKSCNPGICLVIGSMQHVKQYHAQYPYSREGELEAKGLSIRKIMNAVPADSEAYCP